MAKGVVPFTFRQDATDARLLALIQKRIGAKTVAETLRRTIAIAEACTRKHSP